MFRRPVAHVALKAAALPHDAPWTDGAAAVALMTVISSLWCGLVAMTLSRGAHAIRYYGARRGVDAAAGGLFVSFGVGLLAAGRS